MAADVAEDRALMPDVVDLFEFDDCLRGQPDVEDQRAGWYEPSVFRNIFSAKTLFRSASFLGFCSLTRHTRANVPL